MVADAKHTPGPWELDVMEGGFRLRMGSAVPYAGSYQSQHVIEWDPGVYYDTEYGSDDAENKQYLEAEANARRIVAAVNAVEGIPTEALEGGVVRELVEALGEFVEQTELHYRTVYQQEPPQPLYHTINAARRILHQVRGEA